MATSSFERPFKIQDDDAAKAMLDAMDNPTADDHINNLEDEEGHDCRKDNSDNQ